MITPIETLAHTPHRQVPHCPVCGEPRDAGKILCYPCWNSISDANRRGLLRGDFRAKRAILRQMIEDRAARLASLGILPSTPVR
jgi:predicted nucleic acid-binding Zn ribbon protein